MPRITSRPCEGRFRSPAYNRSPRLTFSSQLGDLMMHGISLWAVLGLTVCGSNDLYGAPAFGRPPEAEPMFFNSSGFPVAENRSNVRKITFRLVPQPSTLSRRN